MSRLAALGCLGLLVAFLGLAAWIRAIEDVREWLPNDDRPWFSVQGGGWQS